MSRFFHAVYLFSLFSNELKCRSGLYAPQWFSEQPLVGALLSQTPSEFQWHDNVNEDLALRGPNDCL